MRLPALMILVSALLAAPRLGAAQQPPVPPAADDPGYHFLMARHFEGAGKVDEAIAALKRAIALAPGSAEVRAELAGLYARTDQPIPALNTAEEALKLDPSNREANRILGSILAVLSEQKTALRPGDDPSQYQSRALAALEKAQGDGDLNVLLMLGRLQLRAGQPAKAVTSLRRIVEEQPQYTEGAMLLSAAQEAAGQEKEAADSLQVALKYNPSFFRGYVRLIELYERQRRWKEAAAAYDGAQRANPGADLTAGRAMALINSGAAQRARELLQGAIAKKGKPDAPLLYLLAESQRQLKDYSAAIATSDRLRQAFPGDARFTLQQAQILEETGQIAEAERVLREVIGKDPLDANALNSLGYMFAERGQKLDEAVELLRRAVKIEPQNPSYLDSLGWAFFKQGNLKEADKPLTDAAAAMPDNSVVQDHLGDLRMRQERYAEAVAAWERALAGDGVSIDRPTVEKKVRDARARFPKK